MKIQLFSLAILFFGHNAFSQSCLTIQNGTKTLCNNYAYLKNKKEDSLKKLCSLGNIKNQGITVSNKFSKSECDEKGAIAKCSKKGKVLTVYYTGEIKDLERGCGFLKNTEFTKLN